MSGKTVRLFTVFVLLIAGGALNYVDRATLSVANKLIQDDLGISVAKMGVAWR